jgi:uncharacterized membrane protein YkvA (DUF1232 family)
MNIRKLIAEEVRQVLAEEGDLLGGLEAVPEDEVEAALAQLLPLVQKGFPQYVASQAGVSEGVGDSLKGGLAKTLISLPGGRDLGAMYLAAIDRQTPAAIRIAFVVALANLVSPVDLGTILSGGLLDVMGPLAALDDLVLVRSVMKKMKKAGLPSERHHDQLDQLAGVESTEEPTDEMNERKISKSTLYKIIKEELEVVLTNEEAEEIFNLDPSALLDEMTTVSTDDLYLAEIAPTHSDGAPSYRSEDDEERPLEAALEEEDTSFSDAAKEIEKKGTEGVFTAKAKKAGMGVQAYADKVLKKDSEASTKTKRQAAFAKGAATVARENK